MCTKGKTIYAKLFLKLAHLVIFCQNIIVIQFNSSAGKNKVFHVSDPIWSNHEQFPLSDMSSTLITRVRSISTLGQRGIVSPVKTVTLPSHPPLTWSHRHSIQIIVTHQMMESLFILMFCGMQIECRTQLSKGLQIFRFPKLNKHKYLCFIINRHYLICYSRIGIMKAMYVLIFIEFIQ